MGTWYYFKGKLQYTDKEFFNSIKSAVIETRDIDTELQNLLGLNSSGCCGFFWNNTNLDFDSESLWNEV